MKRRAKIPTDMFTGWYGPTKMGSIRARIGGRRTTGHRRADGDASDAGVTARVDTVTGVRRLLTPASGLVGQGTRYALAGAFVGLVYVLSTTFFAVVVGLAFREALALGFTLQLAVHFTLQRGFVWVHDEAFALPVQHQAGRYLAVAGVQLGLTTASISLLPSQLGVSTEVVYLGTVALLTTANFLLFRNVVFQPTRAGPEIGI
jgi:putative flippase GtrA